MLYLVTVELEMVVEAANQQEAEEVAKGCASDEIDNGDAGFVVSEPLNPESVPSIWNDCYPWGSDGTRTCKEILESQSQIDKSKAEEQELVARQIELPLPGE